MRVYRRVRPEHGAPRLLCEAGCNRIIKSKGLCGPCGTARDNGYYLSPAPQAGERGLDGRRERIALYMERAAKKEDLFDSEAELTPAILPTQGARP